MISSLHGTVLGVADGTVEIDVGGIGYSVQVTTRHARHLRPGADSLLYTRLVVRAESMSLYGFSTVEERTVFDILGGVSGVGPKSALGVLSELSPAQIAQAVHDDDDRAFRAVSGIGAKTAKLITVQLAGKLDAFQTPESPLARADDPVGRDVVTALVGLGWPERSARDGVALARESGAADEDSAGLLRAALRLLGGSAGGAERVAR